VDLVAIFGKLWRYRLVTLPIVALTIAAALYIALIQQPVYEVQSNYVLLNPPAAPTAEDIARDPSLAGVHSDNPYTRFGDQSVVIQVLAATMNSEPANRELEQKGVLEPYAVAPSTDFGYASPIVQITASGPTALAAVRSARILGDAATRELDRMQKSQGVDEHYRIKAMQVEPPDNAKLQASGKLRMLVSVLLFGAVVLFLVTAVIDALARFATELRSERSIEIWEAEPEMPEAHVPVTPEHNGQHNGDARPALSPRRGKKQPR
jgi:hypothetical protein